MKKNKIETASPFTITSTKERHIAKAYMIAKRILLGLGYAHEIDWQSEVSLKKLDESTLLKESAWVILNSGMRESVVRKHFPNISLAFNNWQSAEYINANSRKCVKKALTYFNNGPKLEAIVSIAKRISADGFLSIKNDIFSQGVEFLQQFSYLGPATSLHLAKNIGMNIAKPDRHLKKIASTIGYRDVNEMCESIAKLTEDPVPVIDIVLWRISTLYKANVIAFAGKI